MYLQTVDKTMLKATSGSLLLLTNNLAIVNDF